MEREDRRIAAEDTGQARRQGDSPPRELVVGETYTLAELSKMFGVEITEHSRIVVVPPEEEKEYRVRVTLTTGLVATSQGEAEATVRETIPDSIVWGPDSEGLPFEVDGVHAEEIDWDTEGRI